MSETKKVDCKYWDKCYQKNHAHHEKYNHPKIESQSSAKRSSSPYEDMSIDDFKKQKLPSESPSTKKQIRLSPNPDSESDHSTNTKQSLYTSQRRSRTPEFKLPPKHDNEEAKGYREKECKGGDRNTSENNGAGSTSSISSNADLNEMDITKEYDEVMKNLSGKNYFEIFQRRVRYSKIAEYKDLLKSPEFIRHKFSVEMPSDFYKFWDFCVYLSEKDENKNKNIPPQKIFEKFGLHLVGPFDYLSGNFNVAKIYEPAEYLRHWRFYYDPPEFQTIFWKSKTCIHYGYWRDTPKDNENLLLARNDAEKGCEFEFVGGNCFETVLYYLDKDCQISPFNRRQINEMKKSIEQYAQENDIKLNSFDKLKKARDKNVVCKTFHKAGLVVPYNHKTEIGYRGLIESDAHIKNILSKLERANGDRKIVENVIEALQPIITAANIAVDECDFGTAVELGIDLFCSGHKELHDVIRSLLIPGYSMLEKPQFIAIMKAHLEDRKKGHNLSIFD